MKILRNLPIRSAFLGLAVLPLAVPVSLAAEGMRDEKGPGGYLRFIEDGRKAGRLETAIATFEGPGGARVDLVAAVHVGDRKYYEGLSGLFDSYDALLYEMVKPADAVPVPGKGGGGAIGFLQKGMKDLLGLTFQLDGIDYRRPHFVHADMDLETFERRQKEKGESLFSLMWKAMTDDLRRAASGKAEGDINPYEVLGALMSRDRARNLKLVLGRNFEGIEARAAGLEGEEGSVILTERNAVAIEVLGRTLREGKRRIGLFYGAAHMADLERRLGEMGFRRTGVRWIVAWDIPPEGGWPRGKSPDGGSRAQRL